jgi:hypothetical protein
VLAFYFKRKRHVARIALQAQEITRSGIERRNEKRETAESISPEVDATDAAAADDDNDDDDDDARGTTTAARRDAAALREQHRLHDDAEALIELSVSERESEMRRDEREKKVSKKMSFLLPFSISLICGVFSLAPPKKKNSTLLLHFRASSLSCVFFNNSHLQK